MTAEESYKKWCEFFDKKWWKVYNWIEWADLHRDEFSEFDIRSVKEKLGL